MGGVRGDTPVTCRCGHRKISHRYIDGGNVGDCLANDCVCKEYGLENE